MTKPYRSIMILGSCLATLVVSVPALAWQPTSDHPWPMFHGNYNHIGYSSVVGPAEGNLQWKKQVASGEDNSPPPNSMAIDAKGIIYLATPETLYALKPSGKVKWSQSYSNIQGPALSADGSTVYISGDSALIAVSSKTGKKQWKKTMGNSTLFGPTVGPDGTIYQVSWDGYIYALKPNGKVKWKYLTAGAVSYPASIGKNGDIYVGGGDAHAGPDSYLYALKPSGELKWQYDTGATRVGSPAIGFDKLLYVPVAPTLLVLDKSGTLQWSKGPDTGGGSEDGSDDEDSEDGGDEPDPGDDGEQLQALGRNIAEETGDDEEDTGDGSETTDDIAGIITPAIGSDGVIYIGNSQGVVMAIDPESQEVLWSYQTGTDPDDSTMYGLPSFPVVDKRGRVYIGSVDGKMYAFNKTGDLIWSYQTDGGISEAAPALGPDGTLYFSSDDGYIYAIND